MTNIKNKMDVFFDKDAPFTVIDVEEFRNGFQEIRKRGGRIRAFTEITNDNANYCRKLMNLVDELKHIDGAKKGGIAVSETEYIATTFFNVNDPLTHVIYSNVKEVVEQGQYIFDTMWNNARPALQRLKELEEGEVGSLSTTTRIIENTDEIVKELGRITAESNVLSTCLSAGGLLYSYNNFFEIKKGLVERERRGLHKGVRYVTNIDTLENAKLAKLMLNEGIRIRHANNLPLMSFGVSDKEIAATFESMQLGDKFQNLIISNDSAYLKHFAAIFEELWRNSIDANQRIKEIEEGIIDAPDIEIIRNPVEAVDRILNLVASAESEIIGIFPTINAFRRQLRIGIADILNQLVTFKNIHIRILVPGNEEQFNEILMNDSEAKKLTRLIDVGKNNEDRYPENRNNDAEHVNTNIISSKNLEIKCIDLGPESTLGILVVDRTKSFIIETKEDTKQSSYEAAGLGAYSNSKHMASSFISIFEFLWKQNELLKKIKLHDKMQNEFINTAAHELRTPIQPILSISQIIYEKQGNIQEYLDLLEIITRNAYRLKQLTDDILDVSRIEGKSLKLNFKPFDLLSLIRSVLNDFYSPHKPLLHEYHTSQISLLCDYHDVTIYGDKARLEQVIRNLLSNACNFTAADGTITVMLTKDISSSEWILSVKDNGIGISSDIFLRLFTKFVTKSQHGIGLGLYISKNIIMAHGGRIWAENNRDQSGATFSFTIPMAEGNHPQSTSI